MIQILTFSNILIEIAKQKIPKSAINPKPQNPWFANVCKQSIKERRKYKKACHSTLHLEFTEQRQKKRNSLKQFRTPGSVPHFGTC